MGNQESKPSSAHHGGASSSHHSSHAANQHGNHHERRGTIPRRRESVHSGNSLPGTKATASPSHAASLTSATATTTNSSKRSAEETLKKAALPPPQPLSQPQPQTSASASQLGAAAPSTESMGNSTSKDANKPPSIKPKPHTADPAARPSPLPRPIDVPAAQASAPAPSEAFSPATANAPSFSDASYQLATPSQFSRPPRLPLPIEQEVHAPGSPILSPTEREAIPPIDDIHLSRRASVLSGTTVEDDDLGDDVSSMEPWGGAPTVPTLLEWREEGEKVYVTGTFAGWDKKFRLHRK